MNTGRKITLLLIVAGVVVFGALKGVIMPRLTENGQQPAAAVSHDPLSHDFDGIVKYKNKYMGNASNFANLFYSLPLSDVEMTFQLFPEELTGSINYKKAVYAIGKDKVNRAMVYNATAAFALIENLEAIQFNFEEASYKVLRSHISKWYGAEPHTLAEKAAWKKTVQDRLKDDEFVKSCVQTMIVRKEERAFVAAIEEFYGTSGEPVVIYEQVPFEEGTLVLAEQLTDGEHYPDLHFIDADNKVVYQTRGSSCWTLNYTQFKGHYIYFGLAGVETRRYEANPAPVEKVEVLFSDKVASMIPREEIIAHISSKENDNRVFDNPQGYIIPVEGGEIPVDFIAVLKNGERKGILGMHISRNSDHMPKYLKSKRTAVFNSFAFTFSPMLTPVEWDKGYNEGEILIEGKTDNNGNRNALYLRPAGHMGFEDSFILPQDMKPLYLSDNYTRTTVFSAGETVTVKYPENRELVDCRIMSLTMEKVEGEIGQDSLAAIDTDEKRQLILPREKGYYLFLLRTAEAAEIQTYTGIFEIK